MTIFVTGGAGYIGSHTVLSLLLSGKDVVVLDNFCNSSEESIKRVGLLANQRVNFYTGDVRDSEILNKIFEKHAIDTVIHFAALKSVSESVQEPLNYYNNNIIGLLTLLECMRCHNIHNFIFSSSATVYGEPERIPLSENCRCGDVKNPYGYTKLIGERVVLDTCQSDKTFKAIILRYFNPIGAHPSGYLGEDPNGIPNNLLPYILKVGAAKLEKLTIYGGDYPTPDGTGIRDYIHVMDLAEGHLAALNRLMGDRDNACEIFNLGTGKGVSVLEIVRAFERVCGLSINYTIGPRRVGDVAECWSDPSLANEKLEWKAKYNIDDMLRDSWNWQKKNPKGYSI